MTHSRCIGSSLGRRWILLLALLFCGGTCLLADAAAEDAGSLISRARETKDPAAAATLYREFLRRFPNHAEVPAARYGLGLTLRSASGADAAKKWEEAAALFAAAADGYAGRIKEPVKDGAEVPADLEAAASARCCQAEMLLRLGKTTDARDLLAALLKDRTLGRGKSRPLALYYHGYACILLKDPIAAGRSLGQLAPFDQGAFAGHARALLAGLHHRDEELAEAIADYEAVVADYEARKAEAGAVLQNLETAPKDPVVKARLEALANGPTPAHVGDALFCLGTLAYEEGRFADAQPHFSAFVRQFPASALNPQARLLNGMCLVRLEQFAEAAAVLGPIAEKEPALAGDALFWLARAQAGQFDADDPDARSLALKEAIDTLRRAADKFKAPADARRRAEVLLDLADLQQQAGQAKDAAALLTKMIDDKLLPLRDEELRQRQLTAMNLAGDHAAVLPLCDRFTKAYPKSSLLPEALFRRAESAFFLGRDDEAGRGYGLVAEKSPDFAQANVARLGLAWTLYRKGEFEKARTALAAIPVSERGGELAQVPYLMADCLLRTIPLKADDALAAGKLTEQLNQATDLLNEFVTAQPDDPAAPDALLRLGLCQQRLAAFAGKPEDRNQLMDAARHSYERVFIEYPVHELQPYAAFARARCVAATGDQSEAMARLRSFARGPLAKHPAAAPAMLLRANLLRNVENAAPEVVKILAECRKQHEKALLKDPARAGWVPVLQYYHAVALHEAGKFNEARSAFDALRKQCPDRPEAAEALLQWGRALADEGWTQQDQAEQVLNQPDVKPADAEAARKKQAAGKALVLEAVHHFEDQAGKLKEKSADADIRARLLYAAAWGWRAYVQDELDAAREKRRAELQEKQKLETPPEVSFADLDLQPSEKKTRAQYEALIADFPDHALAIDARLELAELYTLRKDYAPAIKLLEHAIDKEPSRDVTDRVRLRMAECRAAQRDFKGALAQYDAVSATPEGAFIAQGHYRAAECLLRLNDPAGAAKRLALFRDQEPLRTVGGVSDVALLRLGHVQSKLKQWDDSRLAYETLLTLFGDSTGWAGEARYGTGWAFFKEKDYKKAQEFFEQASSGDAVTESTARSRLMVGVCLLEQNKLAEAFDVLRTLPDKYGDQADWSALALIEAAHAARLAKKTDDAKILLQRVVREYPKGVWTAAARERLKDAQAAAAHELPAAVTALTPDLKDMPPLDPLGQQKDLRASLDDPTDEMTQSLILARTPRPRTTPAPALSLALPDPFALQRELPIRGPLPVGGLPVFAELPLVKP